jgi:hypothetical protein
VRSTPARTITRWFARAHGTVVPFFTAVKSTAPKQPSFDFYFGPLDALVRVEAVDDQVVNRATRDTFSAQRKASIVRELAAEGFIPDRYRRITAGAADGSLGFDLSVNCGFIMAPPCEIVGCGNPGGGAMFTVHQIYTQHGKVPAR